MKQMSFLTIALYIAVSGGGAGAVHAQDYPNEPARFVLGLAPGGSTDVGVTSTMYSGRDLDYNMIVASDACGTSHDQRAHDMLMDLVFPRMSRVRTTDQVLQMIRQAQMSS